MSGPSAPEKVGTLAGTLGGAYLSPYAMAATERMLPNMPNSVRSPMAALAGGAVGAAGGYLGQVLGNMANTALTAKAENWERNTLEGRPHRGQPWSAYEKGRNA
jgi:hypothetical protein